MTSKRPTRRTVVLVVAVVVAAGLGGVSRRIDQTEDRLTRLAASLRDVSVRAQKAEARLAGLDQRLVAMPDWPVVVERVLPAVFRVEAGDSSGSGFVVGSGGRPARLLTAFHVVDGAVAEDEGEVHVTRDGARYRGRVVRFDPGLDVALVEVDAILPGLKPATAEAAIGLPVLALGSPALLDGSVVSGVVSARRPVGGADRLQVSTPIGPGSSGGPVVAGDGSVVGVVVAKLTGAVEGVTFAVPIGRACIAVKSCKEER